MSQPQTESVPWCDSKRARRQTQTEAFTREFLRCLSGVLSASEYGTLGKDIQQISDHQCQGKNQENPIVAARKRIGQHNDAYLQSGLMVLWSGDDPQTDSQYTIYPASMPTEEVGRLQSQSLVEEHVMERLVDQGEEKRRKLSRFTKTDAPKWLVYILSVKEVREYVYFMLNKVESKSVQQMLNKELEEETRPELEALISGLLEKDNAEEFEIVKKSLRDVCGYEAKTFISTFLKDARDSTLIENKKVKEENLEVENGEFLRGSALGVTDPKPSQNTNTMGLANADTRDLFKPDVFNGSAAASQHIFTNARLQRAVHSIAINLLCANTQKWPPHILKEPVRVCPNYQVPTPPDISSNTSEYVGGHVKYQQTDNLDGGFLASTHQYKIVQDEQTEVAALWTPTLATSQILENVRSGQSDASIGNLSLNDTSLHTSYAVLLSDAMDGISKLELRGIGVLSGLGKAVEETDKLWMLAVLKLEMMPSLKHVYDQLADALDVQTLISRAGEKSVTTDTLLQSNFLSGKGYIKGSGEKNEQTSSYRACIREDFYSRQIKGLGRVPVYASPEGLSSLISRVTTAPKELVQIKESHAAYMKTLEDLRNLPSNASKSDESELPLIDRDERDRRGAIWEDALRELAISGDRLHSFLKVMAGTLHQEVTDIVKLEDRSMENNQRAFRDERRKALQDITSFSQRVVDTVLGSVFKQSKLRVDIDPGSEPATEDAKQKANEVASSLVVVSDEGIERVNDLASGSSGLGFIEAGAQLQNYLQDRRGSPMQLKTLVADLRGILDSHRTFVLQSLQSTQDTSVRASMEFLAEPRNSLIIRLRNETYAAIRKAFDLLVVEMRAEGWADHQMPKAFDCIEGSNSQLTNQFAQLAAYQLSHSRVFGSSSAIYIDTKTAKMNLHMLRIALQRTVRRAYEVKNGNGSHRELPSGMTTQDPRFLLF